MMNKLFMKDCLNVVQKNYYAFKHGVYHSDQDLTDNIDNIWNLVKKINFDSHIKSIYDKYDVYAILFQYEVDHPGCGSVRMKSPVYSKLRVVPKSGILIHIGIESEIKGLVDYTEEEIFIPFEDIIYEGDK